MKNIILIGMPASGKSTVGVVLAKRLGYQFLDGDLLIQEQEKKLLKDIIAEKGIEGFLEIENQVNRDIQATKAVISPGGSIVYCKEAMEHFKQIGKVLYLQVSYETIANRIGDPRKRGVTLREGQSLQDLYEERVQLFEQYADIRVCTDRLSLDETIEAVLRECEKDW